MNAIPTAAANASTAYTPGPWTVCYDDEFDGCPFIPIETDKPVGPELQLICEVRGSSPDLLITDNDRANASLIAAAPDMLVALVDLVNSFEKHRPKEYWDAARAAIAKATGGAA